MLRRTTSGRSPGTGLLLESSSLGRPTPGWSTGLSRCHRWGSALSVAGEKRPHPTAVVWVGVGRAARGQIMLARCRSVQKTMKAKQEAIAVLVEEINPFQLGLVNLALNVRQ